MKNVRQRPIETLLDDAVVYFRTHSHSSVLTEKEFRREIKKYIEKVRNYNIRTIGDFLQADFEVFKKLGIELTPESSLLFDALIDEKKQEAFNLKKVSDSVFGEYVIEGDVEEDDEDIIDDIATFSIERLKVSPRITTILKNNGINNLAELIKLDYSELEKIPHIGDDSLIELKKYIHSLGLEFKNETKSVKERKAELKAEGKKLIEEELDINNKLIMILNRFNILTLTDLIRKGTAVYDLVGMGAIKANALKEALAKKNITLVKQDERPKFMLHDDKLLARRNKKQEEVKKEQSQEEIKPDHNIRPDLDERQNVEVVEEQPIEEPLLELPESEKQPQEEITSDHNIEPELDEQPDVEEPLALMPDAEALEEAKKNNDLIMQRIAEKEKFSAELDRLIEENQELHNIEKALDDELAKKLEILKSMKEGSKHGGK